MIQSERIKSLNTKPVQPKKYVLYWMQASQREHYNHALEYALLRANELSQPLVVFFGLTDAYPHANLRHYHFMLQGLREVHSALRARGLQMVLRHVSPERGAVEMASAASLVVTDCGYLTFQKKWRRQVARSLLCPLIQVETDVIVPVQQASPKEEYSAATFRTKINRQLDSFLRPLRRTPPRCDSLSLKFKSLDITQPDRILASLDVDRTVPPVPAWQGGTKQAQKIFQHFLRHKLDHYHKQKNNPTVDGLSHMSPYLHFGQVSPLYLALQVNRTQNAGREAPGRESYLEELIVRRELSMNFVHYNPHYQKFTSLPAWAQSTLRFHQADKRPYTYTLEQLEFARTHDPYWNAAQKEMLITGKMHGYMRMYWAKKILEWTKNPARAWQIALYLNDKYELDGRDPNGYTGIAWSFGKHDRPWPRRPIFGKVRYMNAAGLHRKFNPDAYVTTIKNKEISP